MPRKCCVVSSCSSTAKDAEQSTAGQPTAKRIGKAALQCCITGCNVRTRHHTMLHRFPNSKERPELYKEWLRAATGGAERSSSKEWADKHVCSRHFERRHLRGEVLATDAAPTLCLTEAENAAYVERRVSDELASYLHRKTALQGQTPVGVVADEGSVQGQSDLPIRDLIIPTGPRVKKLGRHSHYGCSVKGCYATNVAGIDSFPFPENKLRQKQWLKSIILSESRPMSELRVCTRHFAPGSFRDVNLGLLKTTAVPTLHTGQRSTPKPPPAPESQIQHICCTCLASDVKIYKLNDEQKKHYYALLNVKSGTEDVKREGESEMAATMVCYECVGALAKLYEFRERARVARSTLLSYTHSGQMIKDLDRSSVGLASPLSWCNLDGYSIEPGAAESGGAATEPTEDPIGLDMEVEESDSCEAMNMEEGCKEWCRCECDVCGERFKQRSSLIRHVRAHTLDNNWGWEKHVCEMCFRSFPHSRDLLEHVSRHHTRSVFHYAEITEQTAARTRRNLFIENRSITKPNSRIDCNEEFSKRNSKRVVRIVPSNAKRRLLSVKLKKGRARELAAKSEGARRRDLVKEGKFERIDVVEIAKDSKVKEEPFLDMEVLDENLKAHVV